MMIKNIKTTINIKKSLFMRISAVASQYDVSKSFIINSLVRKALLHTRHKNRFFQRVGYQKRLGNSSDSWRCMAVSFLPDVYEKCFDVRKLSKISVSLFVSFAFDRFLDQVVEELEFGKESDNYSKNYILLCTQTEYITQIIVLWDMIEPEKLKKLKEIHT